MLIEESIALACASLVALHALAMAVSGLSLCSRQHSAKSFHAAGVLPQPVACCVCDAGMWIEFEPTWPAPSAASTNAAMQVWQLWLAAFKNCQAECPHLNTSLGPSCWHMREVARARRTNSYHL